MDFKAAGDEIRAVACAHDVHAGPDCSSSVVNLGYTCNNTAYCRNIKKHNLLLQQ